MNRPLEQPERFLPRFFTATDNFDEYGRPYSATIRIWHECSGAYLELYTKFISESEHQAIVDRAVKEARTEAFREAAEMLKNFQALKREKASEARASQEKGE